MSKDSGEGTDEPILVPGTLDILHDLYAQNLKSFGKVLFDPFCRGERIELHDVQGKTLSTTVGQLNFFRWLISNNVMHLFKQRGMPSPAKATKETKAGRAGKAVRVTKADKGSKATKVAKAVKAGRVAKAKVGRGGKAVTKRVREAAVGRRKRTAKVSTNGEVAVDGERATV